MSKRFVLLVIIISLFSFVGVGCSNKGSVEKNKQKYEQIQVGDNRTGEGGDSIEEVVKNLGKPDDIQRTDIVGFSLEKYIYYDFLGDGITVTVDFSNGRVAAKNESNLYRKE